MHKNMKNNIKAYIYLTPLFVGLFIFGFYPPISAFFGSLFLWRSGHEKSFVGFGNFSELFRDIVFLNSFVTMLELLIPTVLIGVIVPFIVAELIFFVKDKTTQGLYRVLILLPIIVPGVVSILIWKFIYSPELGLINSLFTMFGISHLQPNWLGDPDWVVFSLIFIGFPWVIGTNVLIYLAGLMGISTSVIESAEMEGATGLKRIWHIDIPQLYGQIKFFIVFGLIGGMQEFGKQLIITDGGPGYYSMVPGYYLYKSAFRDGNYGQANAIGVILFVLILLITVTTMKAFRSDKS